MFNKFQQIFFLLSVKKTLVGMFSSKCKSKFLLSIGEEGIILLYFKDKTLSKRYFAKGKDNKAIYNLISCLSSDKQAPLYLVLNHSDQSYLLYSIPKVNRISAYLSAKAKAEHFANNDISSIILLEKPNKFNKNWWYLFVSSKSKLLTEYWLDIFVEIGSNFKGILMFPLELESVAKKILYKSLSDWQIIVVATKTGGYRHIVLKEKKMVFTRLIPLTNDLPGIVAGGIYHEVRNTVQYLTRFGFEKKSSIELCIVVSEAIKASLAAINFLENSVSILTPYELSKVLEMELAISEKDSFCDTIILFHSFKNKAINVFNSKETREFYLFNCILLKSTSIFLYFTLVLVLINIFCLRSLYLNFSIADNLFQKQNTSNIKLEKLSQNYNVKKIDEVFNFIKMNNFLSKIEYSPLTQIKYIEKLKVPGVDLQSFKWNYDESRSYITTTLRFSFQTGQDISNKENKLRKILNDNFRTHDISISSLSSDQNKNLSIDVKIGESM